MPTSSMTTRVEAVRFSKSSLNFYHTTRRIIPGDGSF